MIKKTFKRILYAFVCIDHGVYTSKHKVRTFPPNFNHVQPGPPVNHTHTVVERLGKKTEFEEKQIMEKNGFEVPGGRGG